MTSDQGTKPAASVSKGFEKKVVDSVVQNQTVKSKGSLLFFLNPKGAPCRMQDKILDDIYAEIEQYVDIISVSTDIPGDRSAFYKYGIRALPAIILLDSKGKIAQRFSPGIKNSEELVEAIKHLR